MGPLDAFFDATLDGPERLARALLPFHDPHRDEDLLPFLTAATVASCTQKMRVMLPAHVFTEFERLHRIRRKPGHGIPRRLARHRRQKQSA